MESHNLPWCCVYNFSGMLYSFEKQHSAIKPQSQMDRFHQTLDFCNLQDLGLGGDTFTWRNNNDLRVEGYICDRLEQAVPTPAWRLSFC
jgi:hypothetical protein